MQAPAFNPSFVTEARHPSSPSRKFDAFAGASSVVILFCRAQALEVGRQT